MSDNLVICGRDIGHADGWDPQDEGVYTFYTFVPNTGLVEQGAKACECLTVDYNDGWLIGQDIEGFELWKFDLPSLLSGISR